MNYFSFIECYVFYVKPELINLWPLTWTWLLSTCRLGFSIPAHYQNIHFRYLYHWYIFSFAWAWIFMSCIMFIYAYNMNSLIFIRSHTCVHCIFPSYINMHYHYLLQFHTCILWSLTHLLCINSCIYSPLAHFNNQIIYKCMETSIINNVIQMNRLNFCGSFFLATGRTS